MNAWEQLGLPVQLAVSADKIEEQFRAVSEGAHPDAGGEAGEFERLREARDLLKDDFRRLDHWLELKGVEVSHSGAVSEEIRTMFGRVNEVTTGVDTWLEKGGKVTSGLGKALWQKEGMEWKTRLEVLLDEVAEWQERVVATFFQLEADFSMGDAGNCLKARSEMGFLRKWKQQLQTRYGRIWEGLV